MPDPILSRLWAHKLKWTRRLIGAHQHRNRALAIAAAVELATQHRFPITPAAIQNGLQATRWPARFERIQADGVAWILDVAHNPAGAWALRAGLRSALVNNQPHTLIFSCLRDKPLAEMAQILFPIFDRVILAPIHAARAASLDDLMGAARRLGTPAQTAQSIEHALELARSENQDGTVVISGSIYLVGEARSILLGAAAKGSNP